MSKPVIAVMPLYDEKRESIWMIPGYMDGIYACGAVPIILPRALTKEEFFQLDYGIDGYLFTGGQDVSPELYNEEALESCGRPEEKRDELESMILKHAYADNKPVLGICRGVQLMNAVLGGTLYQDLPSQRKSDICHVMTPPYDRAVHKANIFKDTKLFKILGESEIGVNSYHHQAVKEISPKLTACAAASDGLIEALEAPDRRFFIGVQWHPELFYKKDEASRRLFCEFVEACK